MNRSIHGSSLHHDPRRSAQPAECSQANALGFRPAFFDFATCSVYPSRYRDGRPAPFHLLDGLPEEAVLVRSGCGRVVATKSTLIAGFERNGFFYTRAAAARAVAEWRVRARWA